MTNSLMPNNNKPIGLIRSGISNAYLVTVICIGVQFLQIHRASAYFFDDLNFMYPRKPLGLSVAKLIEQFGTVSSFMYYDTWVIFRWLDDPLLIKLFMLTIVMLGVLSFLYIASNMGINLILSLIAITLGMTLWFNASPIFFIGAFSASFSWAYALISMALFLFSFKSTKMTIRIPFFLLSVFVYWLAVVTYAQQAFSPFVSVMIGLLFLYNRRPAVGTEALVPIRKFILLSQSALYILLTTAGFIIRKYAFNIEYHYYKLGLIDHSIGNIIKNIFSFFERIFKSFTFYTIISPRLPPADFYIAAAITFILVAFLIYYKGKEMVEQQRPMKLLLAGCVLFIYSFLTLMPTTIVIKSVNRYHFAPSIFFIAGCLFLICALVLYLTKRTGRRWIYLLTTVIFAFLFLIFSFNRFNYIEASFVSRGIHTKDLASQLKPFMEDIPKGGQIVIIDHPAQMLSAGLNHWSGGILKLTSGRKDISGIVTSSKWGSDLFSSDLIKSRNGSFYRKKGAGMKRNRPLAVYVYERGRLRRRNYITVIEDGTMTLFSLKKRKEPPLPLIKVPAGEEERMIEYESANRIAGTDIWHFKPYPPDFFD